MSPSSSEVVQHGTVVEAVVVGSKMGWGTSKRVRPTLSLGGIVGSFVIECGGVGVGVVVMLVVVLPRVRVDVFHVKEDGPPVLVRILPPPPFSSLSPSPVPIR